MAILNFDSTNVAPQQPMEVIPAGWYNMMMTASEMKPTSNADGSYLACEFTILDGQFAKRKIFTNLNLQNKNPLAQEIAYAALSAICHATGVIQVADSAQLHNIPLQVKVGMRAAGKGPDGNMYDASNEVKGYKAIQAATAVAVPGMPPAGLPPAAAWTPPAAPAAPAWTPPAAPAQPAAPAWQPPVAAPVAPVAPQAPAQPAWAAVPAPVAPVAPAAAPVAPAAPQAPAAAPPWAQAPAAPAA